MVAHHILHILYRNFPVRSYKQRHRFIGIPFYIRKEFVAEVGKPIEIAPYSCFAETAGTKIERSVSLSKDKPDAIGGVLWFGVDDANMTVFTPVYCCATKAPVCYTRVDNADYITFSWNSSFWIFNWVSNMIYPRYDLMIGDLRSVQRELEETFNRMQEKVEETAAGLLEKDKKSSDRISDRLYGRNCPQDARYMERTTKETQR